VEITYPFKPNMADCKMAIKSGEATCYIFDTCCKDFTPEKKQEADNRIMQIYIDSIMRKKARPSQ